MTSSSLARGAAVVRQLMLAALLASTTACGAMFGIREHEHLLEQGVRARAVVLSLRETGTFINRRPQCEIGLRVEPVDGDPYDASVRQVLSITSIPRYQPGNVMTVRYDPRAPHELIIEAVGEPSKLAPPMPAAEAERLVEASQALLLALNRPGAGVAAAAIVTRFEPTGVQVNGDNSLVTVTVKVLPVGAAPYDARIVGVFAPSGVAKYQPGREVHVLVDPADAGRVTFDMSHAATVTSP